ncbi:MAG: DUF354 domain-containing protein [Deltaproteobacteria bacterium]|nr:DUF354 domain-containing protein [Deltaproteobacteria bacterium]
MPKLRILADITHPAHVHFFRNSIDIWQQKGHEVLITSREKDLTLDLLDELGYAHRCLSKARSGVGGLARELLERQAKLFRLVQEFRPDAMCAIAGTFIVHVGWLRRIPSLVFYDTENAVVSNFITYPFATEIHTPHCYQGRIRRGQVCYPGYHELAYLHPCRFAPDPAVLAELGFSPDEVFTVVRFVGWGSGHDIGDRGFSPEGKKRLVAALEPLGRVVISSEAPLPPELAPYAYRGDPSKIHHLLHYASLYVGESATMASEAAVMGTPGVFVSPLGRGYTDEQEERYGLVRYFRCEEEDAAIATAVEWLSRAELKEKHHQEHCRLLDERIDVTAYVAEVVEEHARRHRARLLGAR